MSLFEREKLFDTSLYSSSDSGVLAEDLAGLYIEAGKATLEERINPRKLNIVNGRVIDPKTKGEVPGNLKRGTELADLEANSAESFYRQIRDGHSLVISFSPAKGISPYKQGRINVGYRSSCIQMEFYGIPTNLSPEILLAKSILLSEFSNISLSEIKSPDDLRGISIPILIPLTEESPWDFLEEIFPIDSNAWKDIKEGKPWVIKENVLKDASRAAPTIISMVRSAKSEWDYVVAGAYGERQMEAAGWKLNPKDCPGSSNSELLNTTINGKSYTTDSFGNVRETSDGKFVKNCGNCGTAIDKFISKGYICKNCGGVYEGC